MQSPSVEIHAVIKLVHSSISPDIQKAAVNKYFAADAAFRHPLYRVERGPLSREGLLGIYQWYRIISPKIEVDIRDVFYDRLHDIVFVDLVQTLHVRFSPFNPITCRSLSRFTLRKCDGVHYICLQEDFLHPDDLAALLFPPLIPIVRTILFAIVIASDILAKWARFFGSWRASNSDVDHVNAEDIATKPVKPRPGEGKLRQKNRREVSRAIKRSLQSPEQDDNDLENFTRDLDIFEVEEFSVVDSHDGSNWSRIKTPPKKVEYGNRTNGKRFNNIGRETPYAKLAVPPTCTPTLN